MGGAIICGWSLIIDTLTLWHTQLILQDDTNPKVFYRRGQALEGIGWWVLCASSSKSQRPR